METSTRNNATTVVIVPRFDAYTASDVEATLKNLITSGNKKIICDFSKTEYIASAGLRVLLSLAKSLQNSGGQILLVSLKPNVYEVFEISGFSKIFKIFNSEKEALQNLNRL